jgi:hypothetical protein
MAEHLRKPKERRTGGDRRRSKADLYERLETKRLAIEKERRTRTRRGDDPPPPPTIPDDDDPAAS